MPDDLAKELEDFEKDLEKSYDDEGNDVESQNDLTKVDDDKGQEADPVTPEPDKPEEKPEPEVDPDPDKGAEATETDEKDEVKLTTLPDDSETFGELAGKEVTAEQLIEAGLLGKLVTWGHQGRHMVKKGQKELEEAKAEKSEAQKLRELLQERFEKEDRSAEKPDAPPMTETEFATALVENYVPGLKVVAEQGGIEAEFVNDFPKAAAQIEHRFQGGADVLTAMVKELGELRELVQKHEERQTEAVRVESHTAAEGHFDGLMSGLAKNGGELFAGLDRDDTKEDFVKWLTTESEMKITDKEVSTITADDVQGAWLLYAHTHPDVLSKQAPKNDDAKLAAGGGGRGSSGSKTSLPDDEMSTFVKELAEAEAQLEY